MWAQGAGCVVLRMSRGCSWDYDGVWRAHTPPPTVQVSAPVTGWAVLGWAGLYSGYRYDLPLDPGVFLHLAIYELKLINIIVFCLLVKDRNVYLLFVN